MADRDHERVGEPEIATTTLAEIYVQQGLLDRALAIYRRVADRSPGDPRIAGRVVELERELERLRAGDEISVAESRTSTPEAEAAVAREARSAAASPDRAPAVAEGARARPAPRAAERDAEFLAWLERR
jgi:hypothetical protein